MRRNQPPLLARPTGVAGPVRRCPRTGSAASNARDRGESYTKMVPADALRWSIVSTRLGWWIAMPVLAALGTALPAAAANAYEGQPIASVKFDPERQPLTLDQLLAMLPLRVGQPLRES